MLLLEAGGDPRTLHGGDAIDPTGNRLPDDYDVPVFHAIASENEAMKWDFWVKHYKDPNLAMKDNKYFKDYDGQVVNGVLEVRRLRGQPRSLLRHRLPPRERRRAGAH